LGALTDEIKARNSNLTLIEYDRTFAEFWRAQGLDVNELDALKMKWQTMPWQEGGHLLVSNLPYQISSRLVVDLSMQNPSFDRMTLMFQKEVAQRIQAQAGTAEYGLLTVVAQVAWRIRLVLEAGAVDFLPKPNVASRVLLFDRKEPRLEDADYPSFLKFLKVCFQNRRKKLLPKLTGYQKKPTLKEIFMVVGLNEDVRAEKLEPEQFLLLYFALKKEYE
jgi:16S rRNA (adenine1518-N6/adenine1519-N6)-dimethyltransferase